MRSVLLALLVLAVIVGGWLLAFHPGPRRLTGEDLHVVDGWWVGRESPCVEERDVCHRLIAWATWRAERRAPGRSIVRAVTAEVPRLFENGVEVRSGAGIVHATITILDLDDGRRMVFVQSCDLGYDGETGMPTRFHCVDATRAMADSWRIQGPDVGS